MVDNNLILKRAWGEIRYAVLSSGKMPSKDYLESLDWRERIKMESRLENMATNGTIKNNQKFRKLEDEIWEFKSDQHRMPCFQVSNCWILTHGFVKKSDKTKRKEIDRAKKIMKEHMEREKRMENE